jgi:glutathione synthase/RimK-type ligase-like ATP-grasp enzyme
VLATAADLPGLHHDEEPLLEALTDRGVPWRVLAWDDPSVDWGAAALVVIRSTWDYVPRRDEFVAWARRVGAATSLWNHAETVAWNTDKHYLRRFAAAGVDVVPTRWLERGTAADLPALLAETGWSEAVVKPVVSAGSMGTVRFSHTEAPAVQRHLDRLLEDGDVMVQAYAARVESEGEISVMWIDGDLTHAIRKVPRPGDFRVQEEFGGRYERVALDDGLRAAADAVIAQVEDGCRYGRVDLLPGADGRPQLVELELVEPQLFLRHEPVAAARLADAIFAETSRS